MHWVFSLVGGWIIAVIIRQIVFTLTGWGFLFLAELLTPFTAFALHWSVAAIKDRSEYRKALQREREE